MLICHNYLQTKYSFTSLFYSLFCLIVACFSSLVVFVLWPGLKTGVEGNQRTAGPPLSLHELPEARRGRACAPVLPRSWYVSTLKYKISQRWNDLTWGKTLRIIDNRLEKSTLPPGSPVCGGLWRCLRPISPTNAPHLQVPPADLMSAVWLSTPAEEFNDRILCPELSDSQKKILHEELRKIYETYCLDESVDKIRFDPFIVEEIRNSMWSIEFF